MKSVSPDWNTLNPMSNEGTRLAVVENEIKTMQDNQKEIFRKLESIQRFQWMIGGAVIILEFIFKK